MKCISLTKLISLQNNLLKDSEKQEINNHLQSCDECKTKLQNYKKYNDIFKRSLFLKTSADKDECFNEFELTEYLEGRSNTKLKTRIYNHLSQCQSCFDNLISLENLLHELKEEGLLTSDKIIKEYKPTMTETINSMKYKLQSLASVFAMPKPAYRWVGAMAIFIIAVIIFVPHQNLNFDNFITRENQNDLFENNIRLITPANELIVNENNPEFRWSKIGGVSKYSIMLLDSNGDIVWEKQSNENKLNLPPDISLIPSMTYYWQVEAFFEDGSSIVSEMSGFSFSK